MNMKNKPISFKPDTVCMMFTRKITLKTRTLARTDLGENLAYIWGGRI